MTDGKKHQGPDDQRWNRPNLAGAKYVIVYIIRDRNGRSRTDPHGGTLCGAKHAQRDQEGGNADPGHKEAVYRTDYQPDQQTSHNASQDSVLQDRQSSDNRSEASQRTD